MKKNLLITGVAGFIGSRIAAEAIKRGYGVVGVDDLSQGYSSNIPDGLEFIKLDLSIPDHVSQLPGDVDYILHLAGQSSGEISFDNPVADLAKNAISTLNLIQFGIRHRVRRILYASSMSVYGNTPDSPTSENHVCSPLSCYGAGKLAAEHYLKIYKDQLPYTAFRMFNVYGPGQDLSNLRQGMVSIYLAHAIKNQHIEVKGSTQRFRDFVFIEDVVNIWLDSLLHEKFHNLCINLGTGVRTEVAELITNIQHILPSTTHSVIDGTPGDQFGIYANMNYFLKLYGSYTFTPLSQGLSVFADWAKKKMK